MVRVTILSPNQAMRAGLREMLSDQQDIRIAGVVREAQDIDEGETDVLVMASVPPSQVNRRLDGVYGILVLTDDPEESRVLIQAGWRAWGILPPACSVDELIAAIQAVGEGLWVGTPALVRGMLPFERNMNNPAEEMGPEPLTSREQEVLQRLAEGLANKQIALQLGISEHTVKFHLSSLYLKLNASSRTEAVRKGLNAGLISL
ncbi:MAG: response regulator transcription factor [Chloroflexi bacterium]|nr:response regulator transcription factor [Chloroflexota bacterium]